MKIKEWLMVYKWPILIWSVIFMGASFLGCLGARFISIDHQEPIQKDTVYVEKGDSLLRDISFQVREINRKIPIKKPVRRHRPCKDTLRIDASLHIDNK